MKNPSTRKIGVTWLVLFGSSLLLHAQSAATWPSAGQNIANTRYAASETTINTSNVSGLRVKWIFTTGDDVSATPSVDAVANVLYFPDFSGHLYKVNASSGQAIWTHAMTDYGLPNGIISRTTPTISGNAIVVGASSYLGGRLGLGAYLLALDSTTGNLMWKVQPDPNPNVLITTSPIIYQGVIYIALSSSEEGELAPTFRGSVEAFSLATGAKLWQTYVVPPGYTGGAIWSSTPAVDTKRGSLYVTTGNNYTVPQSVQTCERLSFTPAKMLACQASDNYFDSIVALDLATGNIKWGTRMLPADAWTAACRIPLPQCPAKTEGPDYDFGAGANLFTTTVNGASVDIVGAGQKSGVYWALNPDDGTVLWSHQVGSGGKLGGIQWGTATDGQQIYAALSNTAHENYALQPSGQVWNGGSWAALNAGTGKASWQVVDPGSSTIDPTQAAMSMGPVTAANGVLYVPSMSGYVYALDATSGATLWSYNTGASVNAGAAVVNGSVYWGSGYSHFPRFQPVGTSSHQFFAFSLQ